MPTQSELRALLQSPAESLTVEYKGGLTSPKIQLERIAGEGSYRNRQ